MASEEKIPETLDQVIEEISNKNEMATTYEPPSPLTGCYLLIILGEPHSQEHKDIILQRLLKGLLSWNSLDCHVDLEEELNNLTSQAPEGEAARHGERLIQFASENLVTEILIHPQYNTLIQCMRNLLSSFTRHRHIIHSGYTFSGNGSWILQDATFSVSDFTEALQDYEVQRVMRAYPDTISMEIHCATSGHWNKLPEKTYAKLCKIRINSVDILDSGSEKLNAFINYLSPLLAPANLHDLMGSSDVVGNIRFSHPTLYVFPGGQGDAALFGINGFNMLVDGGFNRKSCFWDFARHLDRLDAVLMTRINNANIQGISSVIERKALSNVYPQIGYFFTNIPESKPEPNLESDKDSDPLLINLFERGQSLTSNLKSINLKPQPCYKNIEPINLYHKVGHGTLDMYVISPSKESKEVKDFLKKWNARDQNLFASKQSKEFQFPLQNLVSICAMLVWQPANPEETITRILFPGSTPDYKIIEGLDKMKHLEFVKHPVCTANQIEASFSTTILSKKSLKSALADKSTHEPILPSKVTKTILAQEKDNKMVTETKIQQKMDKESVVDGESKVDIEKDDTKITKSAEIERDNKTASESKPVVKSRIDSRPPKSMEKKLKKDSSTEKKSSPITTPKKEPKTKEKELKPKAIGRIAKTSPSSTPAKSTKEANNRKVLESKQKTVKTIKKDISQTVEKKEVKEVKPERKAISRRPKPTAGSPMKAVKSKATKDTAVRRPKLDKAPDSNVVSTPSSDAVKTEETAEQEKQILLDDLIEEQEAVREIEAVLQRSEDRSKEIGSGHRAIIDKQDSTTEADEDEEYIIIEKEEQYTEDSVNEQESTQLTGQEEEIQKHQRDSQESEKKRKPSMETTEEEEPQQNIEKSVEVDQQAVESGPIEDEPADVKEEEEIHAAHKMNGDIPKPKVGDHHEEIKSTDDGSPVADEKLPSEEKKTDAKEESGIEKGDIKEDAVNPPESQATAESGATTAPTLPEDEHITLDEIKEDVVIEEKYIKEETKETQVVVPTIDEPVERTQPKPMQFEAQQPHLRELNIKTPDEVADLPVHEEADIAVDVTPAGSRKPSLRKTEENITQEQQQIKTEVVTIEEHVEIKEKQDKFELETEAAENIESKSPIEKKTPSPTSGKKIDDSLTKIEPKIVSPVEKVEYKVEELGQQFENILKDVTGKLELTEQPSDLKVEIPIDDTKDDIKPDEISVVKSPSPKEEEKEVIERKSVSPVDIKQEEISSSLIQTETETDIKTEIQGDEFKSDSPAPKDDAAIELERKDGVVETSDIKQEKIESKSPSPDLNDETKAPSKEAGEVEKIEVEEDVLKETVPIESQKESVDAPEKADIGKTEIESKEIEQKFEAQKEKEQIVMKAEIDISTAKVDETVIEEETEKIEPTKEDKEEKVSVSAIEDMTESKDEKVISKSPSPVHDKPDIKQDDETSVLPPIEKTLESERNDSIARTSDTEQENIDSKSPSPGLKEEISGTPIEAVSVTDSKRASIAAEPEMKESESKDETLESAADKSKSPSPTKDETITESRKQSVAEKVSSDEIERKSISPVESEQIATSPAKEESISTVRKDSIAADDQPKPGPIDLQSSQYTEVYDYSHPFDTQYPQELRETHITTVESPIVEKSKLIDLQVIDKTISETSERDDLILNDIKEEEDEDRVSPPRDELTEISAKIDAPEAPIDVHIDPPRSISPREQVVLKIVANVAEVLKSEKDITDIIPDFNEDELEKNIMQRASTPEIFAGAAHGSRKGSEVESDQIASHDLSASLSEAKTSTTSIDEKEQHEIAEKHQATFRKDTAESIDTQRKESFVSGALDDSRRESAISTFSEKDYTKDESTLDRFSRSNSSTELKHDELDVKSAEIETHSDDLTQIEKLDVTESVHTENRDSTPVEKKDEHKQSTTEEAKADLISSEHKESDISKIDDDGPTVQRMLVTASSEDGGEETEICAEGTIKFSPSATTPEMLSGKVTPDVGHDDFDKKITTTLLTKEAVDSLQRRESSTSRLSDRPESVMSHFSDTTEPELKETCSSPEKQIHEKVDDKLSGSSGKSTDSASIPSSSHGSAEIEGVKTSSDDKEDSVIPKIDEKKPSEQKDEKSVVKPESRADSTVSDAKTSPIAVEEKKDLSRAESREGDEKVISEKPDNAEKVTSADISGPESSASDKKIDVQVEKSPSPPIESDNKDGGKKDDEEKMAPADSSRPESVTKDETKSPAPSSKEVLTTTKTESRSQSVASVMSEEKVEISDAQKSRSQSIVSEKEEIISGKATPGDVSRPESSASDKPSEIHAIKSSNPLIESDKKDSVEKVDDNKLIGEIVSRPESTASNTKMDAQESKTPSPANDGIEKGSLDKIEVTQISKDEPSHVQSAASDVSAKDDGKSSISPLKEEPTTVKHESRCESVASVISEEKVDVEDAQKSRSQSIVSEKEVIISGKATPADVSRPESSASDKKIAIDSVEKDSLDTAEGTKISKSELSRPESATSDVSAKDGQKSPTLPPKGEQTTVQTESVASVISEEILDAPKSRSQSIVSEKDEIISGKATPAADSRPESSASDKKIPIESVKKDSLDTAEDTKMSRPESATSDVSVKDGEKTPVLPPKEEQTTVKTESRSQSVASVVSEEKVEILDPQKSRSQSIVSEKDEMISGKATPADVSRPESSASDKKIVIDSVEKGSLDTAEETKISKSKLSRPESATSDVSVKDGQQSPVSSSTVDQTTVKAESRSQSVASVISGEKVDVEDAQKSRSQSIVSEKDEMISGKATPADVSRPESSASDTKIAIDSVKKDSLDTAEDTKMSRPASATSDVSVKDGQKSPAPSSTVEQTTVKTESRSQSVSSVVSEEKVDILDAQKSRSQSIVSEKDEIVSGKATPADVSRPESSASEKQSEAQAPKSQIQLVESGDKDSLEKIDDEKTVVETLSRPESSVSDVGSQEGHKSPVPPFEDQPEEKVSLKVESRSHSIAGTVDEQEEVKKSSSPPIESEPKDSSRPESRESGEKCDQLQKTTSQSIVIETQEISGKISPADISRPAPSATDKKDKITKSPTPSIEKHDDTFEQKSPSPLVKDDEKVSLVESRCESAASHISDSKETIFKDESKRDSIASTVSEQKDHQKSPSPLVEQEQKDSSRPASRESVEKIEQISRSSSIKDEQIIEKLTDTAQKSRSQSIVSEKAEVLDKITPSDISRPESSASDKKDEEAKSPSPPVETTKKHSLEIVEDKDILKSDTSRPESQASDISSKDGQKTPAPPSKEEVTTTKTESRSQSVASVKSEDKVESLDAQKSRSQSIVSEREEIISGKVTPDDVSRPESSATDKKDEVSKPPTPSIEKPDEKKAEQKATSSLVQDDEKSPKPQTESKETSEFETETIIEKTTTIVQSIHESIDKVEKPKDEEESGDSDLVGMQIASGSTIHGVHDADTKKTVDERDLDDKYDIHEPLKKAEHATVTRESRSKSVASISVFGSAKPPQSLDLEKVVEASKDDSILTGAAPKTSDISTLIEDVKKMDEKLGSKSSGSEKIETTTITTELESSSSDNKLSQQKSAHSSLESTTSDKGSIETVLDGGASGSFETKEHSFDQPTVTKELKSSVEVISKEVSTIKTETKAFRDSDNESLPISDDEAVTSSQKYSYEDYRFERSNSELSKKSDLDIDDSQNDIPPQYGSQEFKSAVTISSSYAIDPMSASFYGELPTEIEKSVAPVTVSTVRTVITKQFDSHHLPEDVGDSSSSHTAKETFKSESGDHKFLDEADLGFEKALEEHRQARGTEVMSTVTSKYEFSTTETPSGQLAETSATFPLTDVKLVKEQPKDEAILSAEALARQLEDDLKKAEERVASWGKPLGLPASINENPPTPKKERKIASAKLKLNNEKNVQRRSNSPNKGKKITPIYMDLTYVPHNGNSYYSHVEFFKRVRARYYVFSGTEPSRDVYNALLEAKQTWEDQNLEVTIIPTYDTDVLGYWVAENEEQLAKYHIDLSPSASRCTINLQDHETCCSAYRLEF